MLPMTPELGSGEFNASCRNLARNYGESNDALHFFPPLGSIPLPPAIQALPPLPLPLQLNHRHNVRHLEAAHHQDVARRSSLLTLNPFCQCRAPAAGGAEVTLPIQATVSAPERVESDYLLHIYSFK